MVSYNSNLITAIYRIINFVNIQVEEVQMFDITNGFNNKPSNLFRFGIPFWWNLDLFTLEIQKILAKHVLYISNGTIKITCLKYYRCYCNISVNMFNILQMVFLGIRIRFRFKYHNKPSNSIKLITVLLSFTLSRTRFVTLSFFFFRFTFTIW